MEYQHYPPPENLRDIIWCFWALDGNASEEAPFITTPAANSLANLIFHHRGRVSSVTSNARAETPFITGIHAQTDRFGQIIIKENFGIFGVMLYPYVLPILFGISASAFTNQLPSLDSVIGSESKELEEKIAAASGVKERITIICQFLQRRIECYGKPYFSDIARCIYGARGSIDIPQLASQSFLSLRQFERKFKEQCGFSPKKFTRIVRFNTLVSNYKQKNCSLASTAYEFGYCDQSHFIEEFREFSGTSPVKFFATTAFKIFHP